ncbi:HlyD family efflux transporter periplasmic adaptor subunit [Pseudogemmatithrix spongiicola]|uniref:HlyD family efflux transporter periplasmic adaptor subunit n=1 Tax=Pseudogemmatithrix spongiicola TaxID=3062599 RepID=A0AA49JTE9_9BACT|nr:HlyD family efflux transporter periplasmic adaptor subunit [Gemmatimonadaceae bacterium 'strain 138']WKW14462.1 HlyD family efflux transporter periplasmic adaptor subunit [Gemmatimonadaceae bacterium 'strain 318']
MDIVRTPPKRTGRKVAIGGGIAAVLLLTIAVARLDPAVPTVARAGVIIDSVRRGDVTREVRGPGSLVPEQIRWITAQASARVERLYVQSGAAMGAGQLILELSNPDLQIQTMQAEQQVRQAEIDLLNLRTNLRSALLTQEGVVATTRTQYVSALQEAAAADSLIKRNLVSEFDLRNRRAQAEEMTTRLRLEQERLQLMAGAIDSQIAVQAGQVEQLRAIAANQQARLRSLTVRAPDAGVLQELDLELGQWVPEGTALAKVVQPGRLKAELRIPESQAKDVAIGQPASVDTRNGIVRGRVARKDPSAVGGSVLVDIALEGPLPAGAVPDLSVDGTIQVAQMNGILYTGRPAVGAASGSVTMFKLEPDGVHAVRVQVELGRSSVNTIEILRGLEPGDRVVLSDMTQYANVDRVRIK